MKIWKVINNIQYKKIYLLTLYGDLIREREVGTSLFLFMSRFRFSPVFFQKLALSAVRYSIWEQNKILSRYCAFWLVPQHWPATSLLLKYNLTLYVLCFREAWNCSSVGIVSIQKQGELQKKQRKIMSFLV